MPDEDHTPSEAVELGLYRTNESVPYRKTRKYRQRRSRSVPRLFHIYFIIDHAYAVKGCVLVDAVDCPQTGAIEACNNAGRSDIIIGGIDNSGNALAYVQEGVLTCCTNQPPMQDGALPVLLAAKYFNGEVLDQVVFMTPSVINADNVQSYLPAQW